MTRHTGPMVWVAEPWRSPPGSHLITRSLAIESIAAYRVAEWASRPEIENWADPYAGIDWLPAALGAAAVVTLVGVPVALGMVFAGRLWAVARDVRRGNR